MNKPLDEKALNKANKVFSGFLILGNGKCNTHAFEHALKVYINEATQAGESEAVVSGDAQDIADRLRQIKDLGTTRFLALDAALMIEYLNKKRTSIAAVQTDNERLREALRSVIAATQAYLPPDGIDAQECINRILAATDNAEMVALLNGGDNAGS